MKSPKNSIMRWLVFLRFFFPELSKTVQILFLLQLVLFFGSIFLIFSHLNFKNSSATGTTLSTIYTQAALIDPYIPDNGILFDSGCYIQGTASAVVGISIFYDG